MRAISPAERVKQIIELGYKFICWGDANKNSHSIVYLECTNGHVCAPKLTNIIYGKQSACKTCKHEILGKDRRRTINDISNRLHKKYPKYTVISLSISNQAYRESTVIVRCENDHTYTTSISSVYANNGCPHCAGNLTYSARSTEITSAICALGIRLLEPLCKESLRISTKIRFLCPNDHENYKTIDRALSSKNKFIGGCMQCRNEHLPGYYNLDTLSDEQKSIKTSVYVVNLFNSDENFWKVGVSTNAHKRTSSYKYSGYEVGLVEIFDNLTLQNALTCESSVLRTNSQFTPSKHFPGHTECVVENPVSQIREFVKGITT